MFAKYKIAKKKDVQNITLMMYNDYYVFYTRIFLKNLQQIVIDEIT